jgi:hypothetical protein
MTRRPGGRNNALKHGAFSQDLVLPDEKREDFEQLHQSLIEEWSPTGALEEDTVLTLAQGIWLKRRVERFYHQEATWAQEHAGEEELNYADALARVLEHAQSVEDVTEIIAVLPDRYREWIETKYHRSNFFNDAQSWIRSVKSIIPKLIEGYEITVMDERRSPAFKAEKAALLRDLTAKKIALDERLDSRIDKAVKRLAQLKALKQVFGVQASHVKGIEHRGTSDPRQ